MSKKMSDYNKMAPYYNNFTNAISEGGNIRSQRYFLRFLEKDFSILNVGCGSVQFNVDLSQQCKNVTAVDISPKMIEYAKRNLDSQSVSYPKFVCSDIFLYQPGIQFDVVFANFVLNTFRWDMCCHAIEHICTLVKPGGLLCIADECVAKKKRARISQCIFRPIISFIHHMWAAHPMHAIYDYDNEVTKLGYMIVSKKVDPCNFIVSTVYKNMQ